MLKCWRSSYSRHDNGHAASTPQSMLNFFIWDCSIYVQVRIRRCTISRITYSLLDWIYPTMAAYSQTAGLVRSIFPTWPYPSQAYSVLASNNFWLPLGSVLSQSKWPDQMATFSLLLRRRPFWKLAWLNIHSKSLSFRLENISLDRLYHWAKSSFQMKQMHTFQLTPCFEIVSVLN